MKRYIYYPVLLVNLLFLLSDRSTAQTIELLGVYSAGDHSYLNAKIDLAGKRIKQAMTYTFRMSDGYTVTNDSYELLDGTYISALLTDMPEECAYRLEVVLDDDTRLLTECVDKQDGTTFMWLGDYPWTEAVSGWDETFGGPHPPRVDMNVDPSLDLVVGQTTYYKGISNKAPGYVVYDLPVQMKFVRLRTRLGVQNGTGGNMKFGVLWNNATSPLWFTRSSGGSYDLNTDDYSSDIPDSPLTHLRLEWNTNGSDEGDLGHFLLARFEMEAKPAKTAQTVTFQTQSATIRYPQEIRLNATASSGGKVYYRLVGGNDLATLDGDLLRFKDNRTGVVAVEAIQYGNEQYACANQVLTFTVNTGAVVYISAFYPAENGHQQGYLYVDTKGRTLTRLRMTRYDNAMNLSEIETLDLWPFVQDKTFSAAQVVGFPIAGEEKNVYRLSYAYEDQVEVYGPYCEGLDRYDYLSDLPCTYQTGWGTVGIDKSVSGGVLDITGQLYKKGFGIHANGWVESTIPLGKYARFVTDVGKQRGRPYLIEFALKMNGGEMTRTGGIDNSKQIRWDFPTEGITTIHIDVLASDGNGSDHGAIGAPRLYWTPLIRKEQHLEWRDEQVETRDKPFRLTLDAQASSGLPPVYRIVAGQEYAQIEEGNVLNVFTLPGSDSILVEACQPGNLEWGPTEAKRCIFRLVKGRIVQKDEFVSLDGGETLDELIVYADAYSSGQVTVKEGIAKIRKLIIKYRMTPTKVHLLSFPSDVNLDEISDLNALGYYHNRFATGEGGYSLFEFDPKGRAEHPHVDDWMSLQRPEMKRLKGYILMLNDALGTEPKEVTFTIDNVSLNFDSPTRFVNLTLDLRYTLPYTQQAVYVTPANVKGNTLKVWVTFDPEDLSALPVNYEYALKEARVTYAPNRAGIRLTLPDPTPAKVAIYDGKTEKLMKAVRYISPMMIDISDLPAGTYRMIVSYGYAIAEKTFSK